MERRVSNDAIRRCNTVTLHSWYWKIKSSPSPKIRLHGSTVHYQQSVGISAYLSSYMSPSGVLCAKDKEESAPPTVPMLVPTLEPAPPPALAAAAEEEEEEEEEGAATDTAKDSCAHDTMEII